MNVKKTKYTSQKDKFKQVAKLLGCDESEDAFNAKLKKLAKPAKPKKGKK